MPSTADARGPIEGQDTVLRGLSGRNTARVQSGRSEHALPGELEGYHPPTDIRTGEHFPAEVDNAVRSSPSWAGTVLLVRFDEHGGTFVRMPPPAAPVADEFVSNEGFAFDRFGTRDPAILVSAYTAHKTVIVDQFHHASSLRTVHERFDPGPPLTRRAAAAPLLSQAFNLAEPRNDAPFRLEPPCRDGVDRTRGDDPGDDPDLKLTAAKIEELAHEKISQLGHVVLPNAAALSHHRLDGIPAGLDEVRS